MANDYVNSIWQGEGWYQINYSDGGQSYDAIWYEDRWMLTDDYSGAHYGATECHLPYIEYLGDGEAPEV